MKHKALMMALALALSASLVKGQETTGQQNPAKDGANSKAIPRTPDGKPDLSGFWGSHTLVLPPGYALGKIAAGAKNDPSTSPANDKHLSSPGGGGDGLRVYSGMKLPPGLSYQPWALAKVEELRKKPDYDPGYEGTSCLPLGIPRETGPLQIIQGAKGIAILYESPQAFRYIPTDGRAARTDQDPSYMGESTGHWDGETLVVNVTNFNDMTWLDADGLFHSEDMHIVERYRLDGDTLIYEATVEDPKVLTTPWVVTRKYPRGKPDEWIEEVICIEKNRQYFSNGVGFH
jgi:hypothetical protein